MLSAGHKIDCRIYANGIIMHADTFLKVYDVKEPNTLPMLQKANFGFDTITSWIRFDNSVDEFMKKNQTIGVGQSIGKYYANRDQNIQHQIKNAMAIRPVSGPQLHTPFIRTTCVENEKGTKKECRMMKRKSSLFAKTFYLVLLLCSSELLTHSDIMYCHASTFSHCESCVINNRFEYLGGGDDSDVRLDSRHLLRQICREHKPP